MPRKSAEQLRQKTGALKKKLAGEGRLDGRRSRFATAKKKIRRVQRRRRVIDASRQMKAGGQGPRAQTGRVIGLRSFRPAPSQESGPGSPARASSRPVISFASGESTISRRVRARHADQRAGDRFRRVLLHPHLDLRRTRAQLPVLELRRRRRRADDAHGDAGPDELGAERIGHPVQGELAAAVGRVVRDAALPDGRRHDQDPAASACAIIAGRNGRIVRTTPKTLTSKTARQHVIGRRDEARVDADPGVRDDHVGDALRSARIALASASIAGPSATSAT